MADKYRAKVNTNHWRVMQTVPTNRNTDSGSHTEELVGK